MEILFNIKEEDSFPEKALNIKQIHKTTPLGYFKYLFFFSN